MADSDVNPTQNSENEKDFNKMISQERSPGTSKGDTVNRDPGRDLGTVGGGTIPSGGPGSSTSTGSTNTDNSTSSAGGSTARSAADAGASTDRGNVTNRDMTTNTGNTMDRDSESNLGGRNPSHPQTAMGDRDADIQRGHSSSTSPVQPMTSRDPSARGKDQDTEKGS
jgi:hypothetical protein